MQGHTFKRHGKYLIYSSAYGHFIQEKKPTPKSAPKHILTKKLFLLNHLINFLHLWFYSSATHSAFTQGSHHNTLPLLANIKLRVCKYCTYEYEFSYQNRRNGNLMVLYNNVLNWNENKVILCIIYIGVFLWFSIWYSQTHTICIVLHTGLIWGYFVYKVRCSSRV